MAKVVLRLNFQSYLTKSFIESLTLIFTAENEEDQLDCAAETQGLPLHSFKVKILSDWVKPLSN